MTKPFRGVLIWDAEKKKFRKKVKERKVEAPAIITDEIPETESMATQDREHFTSKRKLYEHYKEHGYHVKEAGEDRVVERKRDPDAHMRELMDEAEKAYHDIKNDRIAFTEEEKTRWKEEERQYREWKRRNLM